MPILRLRPTNFLTNIASISTGFLDTVNDGAIGGPVATAFLNSDPKPGMLGSVITVNSEEAVKLGKNVTLYAGSYMYVQFKSGSTAANAFGQLVCWDTFANRPDLHFRVTPDFGATDHSKVAGVALGAVTKGNYGWIFIGPGLCSVRYVASPTSHALLDPVFAQASLFTVDSLAIASAPGADILFNSYMGIQYEASADAGLAVVWFV